LTLLGPTEVIRPYYWCRRCGEGRILLDERLGCRGRPQTGKVQEVVVFTMAQESYGQGRRLLGTLTGLEISHQTVESITLELGQELVAQRQSQIAQTLQGDVPTQACPTTLCVSVDGGHVPMWDAWHEARVVGVFPYQVPPGGTEPEPGRISYSAYVEDCEATGRRMYAEAQRRGAGHADRIAVLGDGAQWIWNQAAEHFPGAWEIVDWYHATEHLWQVANTLFPQGSAQARAWEQSWETQLWEGNVKAVITQLRQRLYQGRRSKKHFRGSEHESILQNNLAYFEGHQKRMNYARFRQENLPISSAVVESACKHYLAHRFKRSGMRWKKPGLDAVLELRSALLSHEWHRVQNLLRAA
jgi:hypothetical protein